MAVWHEAFDGLTEALGHADFDSLTLDQKLKVAEIKALLAIGQELSLIHHEGINPNYDAR